MLSTNHASCHGGMGISFGVRCGQVRDWDLYAESALGWLTTPENVPYFLPHCLLLPKLWLTVEVAAPKNVYIGGERSILMINMSDLD